MTLPLSCIQVHTRRGFKAESGDLFHNTGSEPCASNVVRMLHFDQRSREDSRKMMTTLIYSEIQSQSSSGLNQRPISWLADSTASEPWQMLRPTWMEKSPRMEPGREAWGLVSPNIMRPIFTTFRPSHTMAQIGPEFMYSTKPAKNGLDLRSA